MLRSDKCRREPNTLDIQIKEGEPSASKALK